MGVDGIVEILISPVSHMIAIMLVSVFMAGPHQVRFKQTALWQMLFWSVCNRTSFHL